MNFENVKKILKHILEDKSGGRVTDICKFGREVNFLVKLDDPQGYNYEYFNRRIYYYDDTLYSAFSCVRDIMELQ